MRVSPWYLVPPLPEPLEGLAELALDLRWSWSHAADPLWRALDPEIWEATANPWLILQSVSRKHLEALANSAEFCAGLQRQLEVRREYLAQPTWFEQAHHDAELGTVAYFSMEFGLSEAIPIYSGGLGLLAGDFLKAASDLGVPLVGVGLLYQLGYFRQSLDTHHNQLEFYPYNDPGMLPVLPLRDADGEWLRIPVDLPGRTVLLRAWQVQVGRVRLYLLDSNDPANTPQDRGITGELYGGGPETRLQQEIVLGIGGWRLIDALKLPCVVCHLNEGHAAFAVLERARSHMSRTGGPFALALRATRAGNLFTTHTPVAPGFDRFAPELMQQYFHPYAEQLGISMQELVALGQADADNQREPFNMAYLALRGSGAVNGVSWLHGEVSQGIFQPLFPRWPRRQVPVGHVTNGVHMPSWDSAPADALWTQACGKRRWLGNLDALQRQLEPVSDEEFWTFRSQGRRTLVEAVRSHLIRQGARRGADETSVSDLSHWLDPNALTLGFARRFTGYKRVTLLLHDPQKLERILTDRERPVQLVIAGKAHPRDTEGKRMVREWVEYMHHPRVRGRVVFLEDYDMGLASELVQGVDVWINTPRRPWEASGTSGMKVLVNGGLNLSELDGWWVEAYTPEVGWALGDGQEHGDDPGWDAAEAEQLYSLLEQDIIPTFYTRDEHGIPVTWVALMRASMARLTPRFSANRMVREYTEDYYLPSAEAYHRRVAEGGAVARQIEEWHRALAYRWENLHFGKVEVQPAGEEYLFRVPVYLNEMDPEAVRVELYAEALDGGTPLCQTMTPEKPLTGAVNGYLYAARVPADRPACHYTPRIVPHHPDARIPLEASLIAWSR